MQNRRDWIKSSIALGGVLVSPSNFLSSREKELFRPRDLEQIIKLSSNENPYGPSKKVRDAINKSFNLACIYPYSYSDELEEMLAKKHGVPNESVIVTGGSTEGLKITGVTFTRDGGEIISANPTFLAMLDFAKQWGSSINWVPVKSNKGYDLSEIENRISKKTKLIFLCNPNNPTGTLIPSKQLYDFCETAANKTIVFSDEAYYDYIEDPNYPSMIDLIKKDKNIIVSKTFSKVYGMAGLRVGYLVAKPKLAKKIRENIVARSNVLGIEAAKQALYDKEFYNFSLKKNRESKEMIYSLLDELNLNYVKSHTNFIFFHSKRNIKELGAEMIKKGVKIGRPFPPFNDWCRISTGTLPEVQRFIKGMRELYS
jgi:histidinol-phosphate aminotransferase